jgi:ABC-type Fe3+ transport system substrate-binding protein
MEAKKILLAVALLLVVGLPFLFHDSKRAINAAADDTVIILTGHNENVRFELGQGFQRWYRERTGRTVFVDWRYLGGVSEIVRYLESVYGSAFRYHWEHELGRQWTAEIQRIFVHRTADRRSWETELEQGVCGAFYDSRVTSGMDILFGGGVSEFVAQANLGTIVDSGFLGEHPELFSGEAIPQRFAGERLWDDGGRWFGQVLSTFGILRNLDALAALGIGGEQAVQWEQLANPRLFGTLALADPTKSSALLKAYEMIIQQQIFFRFQKLRAAEVAGDDWEGRAIQEGWQRGLEVLQLMSANARYYADAPTKMILDISSGNSALGVIVDFMGQQQCAVDGRRSGHQRLHFVLPENGSAVSPDPIAILRGAPNGEVAKKFLEFVLGEEGQKIVAFSPGTPGGPQRSELFRPAVNRAIYRDAYTPFRSTGSNPYVELAAFDYHPEWMAQHYNALKWIVKFSCIIPHRELADAWKSIIRAREEGREAAADGALRILQDFSQFDYERINETLEPILHPSDPAQALALQRRIVGRFQEQYRRAKRLAEMGKDPIEPIARRPYPEK